jgi:hypothetical protein
LLFLATIFKKVLNLESLRKEVLNGDCFFQVWCYLEKAGAEQLFPTCQCIKQLFFNFNLRKYKGLLIKFEPITGREGLFYARFV